MPNANIRANTITEKDTGRVVQIGNIVDDIDSAQVTTSTGEQTLAEALDQRWIHFATVADMSGAANLAIGDRVRTSGYSASGDGGGNDYEIVSAATGTADGGAFIDLTASGLQAKAIWGDEIDIRTFGVQPGDDIYPVWPSFIAAGAVTGKELVVGGDGDYLTSDNLLIDKSGVNLRFTLTGFVRLTQSTSIGAILVVYDSSLSDIVSDVNIYNPRIDGNDLGYPSGATYGENGVGGTRCRNVKVFGGTVKNCRRGNNSQTGTGGKGIQFETGVSEILVDGTYVHDCTYAMETGGVVDAGAIPPNSNFRTATLVRYTNITVKDCERVVSLTQTDSPPNKTVGVNSYVIDGVIAFNSGREIPSGTEKDYGPIIVDRSYNFSITNVRIFNDASYGPTSSVVRMYRGGNGVFDVVMNGDADNIVLHDPAPGHGTSGQLEKCQFNITHYGTSNYAIGAPSVLSGNVLNNHYDICVGTVNTGLVQSNAAVGTSTARFIRNERDRMIAGVLDRISSTLGNTFPSTTHGFAGTMTINGVLVSFGGAGQIIGTNLNEDLVLARNGSNRITLRSTGVRLSGIPSSSSGLSTGDLWNDAGTLKIV